MTQFIVTPQELTNAATFCTNTNAQIQSQVQQVVTFIDSLISSGYAGPAANQLVNLAEQWNRDAAALNGVLLNIASNLQSNANNYSGSEGQNTMNLVGVGSTLPSGNF